MKLPDASCNPLSKLCSCRRVTIVVVIAFSAAVFGVAASSAWVRHSTARFIYRDASLVPAEPVAIVLGAMVYPNGCLSSVLRARVDAAIALYQAHKATKLLMTGDNSSKRYDEVTAMKKYAMAAGVPDVAIVRDYAGFRTFDSCYRAKHVFAIRRAVIVTQDFHIARAIYLARHLGIDAVGFVAPDNMSRRSHTALSLREVGATMSALVDVHLPWRRPRYVGQVEPIADNRLGR
ncbi:MAG: ElyC/SanA/YdcF family protein [Capsulimonadaceae bacterium]|nr:ElyC/SanA/YdcF family protein [Capsulimonadaceae bacterium]